ncbi:MAG: Biotin carboxyl carrier protein of acetyl-CoA carboxylase [Haliscomenobacter sp.]|jgi:acetyl-CoA carboxylase biotin carboxyl carrier protein|nr:Biotin carboxyl carrier protein of acetyl-CoA carboxylase [Haliscomenobacter sp.]
MDFKEIQELLRLISKLELTEFKLKEGEFELSVRTKHFSSSKQGVAPIPVPAPVLPVAAVPAPSFAPPASAPADSGPAPAAPAPPAPKEAPESPAGNDSQYLMIKSPIVGTFYRSPSPDKPAYVKVGDKIEAGAVVCIVEAMKLFNEIESDISGRIVKVLVDDAQPVEYDQVLFLVDPKG